MSLRTWSATVFAVLVLLIPSAASAQTIGSLQAQIAALLAQIAALQAANGTTPVVTGSPRITLEDPNKGQQFDRDEEMRINWTTGGISRPMVVEGIVKLKKADPKNVGAVGGGSFIKPITVGSTFGQYLWDWGLNDSIPGTYSVSLRLRECNTQGCDIGPAGRAIGKKTPSVEFKVVTTSDNHDRAAAEDLLEEAEELIDDANDMLDDTDAPDSVKENAQEFIEDAEGFFDDAMEALDDEDYGEAIEYAEEAIDSAGDAIELLGDLEEEEEVVQATVEVLDPDSGRAPFTAAATVELTTRGPNCATLSPMGTLAWGDGSKMTVYASTTSTTTQGDTCTKRMYAAHAHTYSTPGTYELKFTSALGGLTDTAKVTVTGRTEAAPSCTLSASPVIIMPGSSSTLSWTTKYASSATLNGKSVSVSGSANYSPATTTTYAMSVFGYTGGKSSCSTTVRVASPNTETPKLNPGKPAAPTTGTQSVRPGDTRTNSSFQDTYRETPNTSNISAAALMAIEGSLKEISRMLEEMFR